MRSLTVYAASSPFLDDIYHAAAASLGRAMAAHDMTLVYGAGGQGLMGEVARAVHDGGGRVVGIITERLLGPERVYADCDELIVVETMRERKRLLLEHGDGVISLPGGVGTLEELSEALTGRYVGEHAKPIGLLDVADWATPLLDFFRHGVEHGFIKRAVMELLDVDTDADALVGRMQKLIDGGGPPDIDETRFLPSGPARS